MFLRDNAKLDKSIINGTGVFAARNIKKGEMVNTPRPCNGYNHSCAPNSYIVYDDDSSVEIFALRDIKQGEEITLKYKQNINFDCACPLCKLKTSLNK